MNVGHLIVSIGVACCVASTSWARAQQVVTVDVAQALLRPDGQPEQHTQVTLRHNWDKSFPGIGGRATYTLQLPPIDSTEPSALLFDSLETRRLCASMAFWSGSSARWETRLLKPGSAR